MSDDAASLSPATAQRMIDVLDETWDLRAVSVADAGFNDVYFTAVDTGAGPRQCVLKVSDGTAEQIRAEARLHRLLAEATALPVPAVLGRVDSRPDVPSPYFLLERVPGEHPDGPPESMPLAELSSLAERVGRHLGDLHAVDAFDAFGWIRATGDAESEAAFVSSDGDSVDPTGPLAQRHDLTIAGGNTSWPAWLGELAEMHLDRHSQTRFGDRTPELRRAIGAGIDRLDGSVPPVIGRVDHEFENLLVDPETGDVTGLLDWGMLRTVGPAYDLAFAEQSFSGPVGLDAEWRREVRTALRDGYEDRAATDPTAGEPRLCLLVAVVARQNWLCDRLPEDDAGETERVHRALLDDLLAAV